MRRGVPHPAPLLPVLLALALHGSAACVQDPDLGADPPATTTSTTTGEGGGGGAGGGAGAGGAGGAPVEPPGPTKLTVVNGVNDYEAIQLCFLPYPDGDGAGVMPWPPGDGLGFARGAAVAPIDAVVPPGASVQPHVIGGDLGAGAGLDCAEILALAEGGQGPLVAAALPVLPAEVFAAERSLLLAPTGCLGGPGHSDPAEVAGCGAGYTAETPTAGLLAGPMSRLTEPGKIALQVAHASAALPMVDVRLTVATQAATEWLIAPSLTLGAVGPFPPFLKLSADEYGVLTQTEIRAYATGSANLAAAVPMAEVVARSEVSASDFTDGRGFVLVAVGAAPGVPAGPFWHALTYALVPADP